MPTTIELSGELIATRRFLCLDLTTGKSLEIVESMQSDDEEYVRQNAVMLRMDMLDKLPTQPHHATLKTL